MSLSTIDDVLLSYYQRWWERERVRMFVAQMAGGLFSPVRMLNGRRLLNGVAVGDGDEFTLMLCERRELHDGGLVEAKRRREEWLADQLLAVALEWGVEHLLTTDEDDP